MERYTDLHHAYVLSQSTDAERKRMLDSKQFKQARQLVRIDLFSGSSELGGWSQVLTAIPVCPNYHPGLIGNTPTCPTCRFRAATAGTQPAQATLPTGFVESVNQALRWLRGVTIHAAEIVTALKSPTIPCTVDDLERRFTAYVQALLAQGNDRSSTRLMIE